MDTEFEQRFWAKVRIGGPGECWTWTAAVAGRGYREGRGYGVIWFKDTRLKAHRVSWEFANGEIGEGLCVLHHCDNPPCVNPAHLYLGTQRDNARDREIRQRHKAARGEGNHSKLTDEEVRQIRAALSDGLVSQSLISRIQRGIKWAHVKT